MTSTIIKHHGLLSSDCCEGRKVASRPENAVRAANPLQRERRFYCYSTNALRLGMREILKGALIECAKNYCNGKKLCWLVTLNQICFRILLIIYSTCISRSQYILYVMMTMDRPNYKTNNNSAATSRDMRKLCLSIHTKVGLGKLSADHDTPLHGVVYRKEFHIFFFLMSAAYSIMPRDVRHWWVGQLV